jgi:hypothetical protein
MKRCVHRLSIFGSSFAFLGWLAVAAPNVGNLTTATLISHELHCLAEYLSVLGAALQELDLTFFDVDLLGAFYSVAFALD